jgi:hypothetical protein
MAYELSLSAAKYNFVAANPFMSSVVGAGAAAGNPFGSTVWSNSSVGQSSVAVSSPEPVASPAPGGSGDPSEDDLVCARRCFAEKWVHK